MGWFGNGKRSGFKGKILMLIGHVIQKHFSSWDWIPFGMGTSLDSFGCGETWNVGQGIRDQKRGPAGRKEQEEEGGIASRQGAAGQQACCKTSSTRHHHHHLWSRRMFVPGLSGLTDRARCTLHQTPNVSFPLPPFRPPLSREQTRYIRLYLDASRWWHTRVARCKLFIAMFVFASHHTPPIHSLLLVQVFAIRGYHFLGFIPLVFGFAWIPFVFSLYIRNINP